MVFAENIVICDQETLTERYCVVVPSSPDLSFSPNFALSDNLLAFADSSVRHKHAIASYLMLSSL